MAYPVKINCYIPGYENCAKENNRLQLMGDTSPEEPDCPNPGGYVSIAEVLDAENSTFQLGETVTGEQTLAIDTGDYDYFACMVVCGYGVNSNVLVPDFNDEGQPWIMSFEWGELVGPNNACDDSHPLDYITFNPYGDVPGEYTITEVWLKVENWDD